VFSLPHFLILSFFLENLSSLNMGSNTLTASPSYSNTSPLYNHTAYLNQIRNHISATHPSYLTYWTRVLAYTSDTLQLRKEAIRTILTNQGEQGGSYTLTTQGMEFSPGETVMDVLRCVKYTANGQGDVDVQMQGGRSSVLVPETSLKGSGICGVS
jgi:alpha-amylase